MNDFSEHRRRIAERFLQTVVVVDDEADPSLPPSGEVVREAGRGPVTGAPEEKFETEQRSRQSLDTRVLVDAFAEKGLICGIVVPRPSGGSNNAVARAAKRADIVVLDWQLQKDDGGAALGMMKEILQDDRGERLRLISVYTGQDGIRDIAGNIAEALRNEGWNFKADSQGVTLSYRHCRIVIYAKAGTSLEPELRRRAIGEEKLVDSLIGDFADMTGGLLSGIALTSLAAIRENAYKVLDKFNAELDPAFLAHRACLPAPDDSQQHMVSQIAGELHGIMNDAVADEDPAGMKAITHWLVEKQGSDKRWKFNSHGKILKFDQTVALLSEGLESESVQLSRSDFGKLSMGFSRGADKKQDLDHRLAWMMNFRAIADITAPTLYLGTVVRKGSGTDDEFLLCITPKCDSIRLRQGKAFLFLPLVTPPKGSPQLVIRSGNEPEEYRRLSVSMDASNCLLLRFTPDQNRDCVIAKRDQEQDDFYFANGKDTRFWWLGELKAEVAQNIAEQFSRSLSRVAVNNSEWLRRTEKKGN